MRFLRTVGRVAAVAATLAGAALAAPAANAAVALPSAAQEAVIAAWSLPAGEVRIQEAPVGVQCGAYRTGTSLRYWHCGTGSVWVEIDYRYQANQFTCVHAWENKYLTTFERASHAWAVGGPCA